MRAATSARAIAATALIAAASCHYVTPHQGHLAQPGEIADWAEQERQEIPIWSDASAQPATARGRAAEGEPGLCPASISAELSAGATNRYFHGRAAREYRLEVRTLADGTPTQAGLQCTYDEDGHLITEDVDAVDGKLCEPDEICLEVGTADRVSPEYSFIGHLVADIVPYTAARLADGFAMAPAEAACTTLYFAVRPSPDASWDDALADFDTRVAACRARSSQNLVVRLPSFYLAFDIEEPAAGDRGVALGTAVEIAVLGAPWRAGLRLGVEDYTAGDRVRFTSGLGVGAHHDILSVEGRLDAHVDGGGDGFLLPGFYAYVFDMVGAGVRWSYSLGGAGFASDRPQVVLSLRLAGSFGFL